jgi:outer membrane murein-binding lipoprotein Lpp
MTVVVGVMLLIGCITAFKQRSRLAKRAKTVSMKVVAAAQKVKKRKI